MNLSQLSVSELRLLMAQVQQTGKSEEHEDLAQARAAILAIAHDAGASLQDLFAAPPADPRHAIR
ncbi:hypothetical protein [Collimonas sp.]|uniref:hypothetical protein n=1 Tax=Collimonas sp. TaxID=1963772 RepID=UPI002CD1631E|nr:hypothetical protein [Collimonas sp.]HWX01141.1 hypothetical protein [Collimonas sp.]